jgi:hypothetical protein
VKELDRIRQELPPEIEQVVREICRAIWSAPADLLTEDQWVAAFSEKVDAAFKAVRNRGKGPAA